MNNKKKRFSLVFILCRRSENSVFQIHFKLQRCFPLSYKKSLSFDTHTKNPLRHKGSKKKNFFFFKGVLLGCVRENLCREAPWRFTRAAFAVVPRAKFSAFVPRPQSLTPRVEGVQDEPGASASASTATSAPAAPDSFSACLCTQRLIPGVTRGQKLSSTNWTLTSRLGPFSTGGCTCCTPGGAGGGGGGGGGLLRWAFLALGSSRFAQQTPGLWVKIAR